MRSFASLLQRSSYATRHLLSDKEAVIIGHVALAKQGDNAPGSIHLSVCLSVCLSELSYLNRLTSRDCLLYNESYQCKVFVYVSVIRGRILITARLQLIGF